VKNIRLVIITLFSFYLAFHEAAALEIIPIEVQQASNEENGSQGVTVNYSVKGKNVYIECIVPKFKFVSDGEKNDQKDGEGHIHLYLNGKKVMDINQAAFIVKGLPKGEHHFKLEFVHNDQTPYRFSEEFTVEIKE